MSLRFLLGPVNGTFADQNLRAARQRGDCLSFGAEGQADLPLQPADTWDTFAQSWPADWQPDFVVVNLWYTSIPHCLWTAPVPLVGLAVDWNLLWHYYRRRLPQCDLILTDTAGVEVLHRAGMPQGRAAALYGCPANWLEATADGPRDIDILFVGNFNPAIQDERLPWLARLARLGDRYRVQIRTGIFGEEYCKLLQRARIVFNRSIRGEANQRTFEATAAGALLFQEAENREVPHYFRDREECVYYTAENLESLLAYYLEQEAERQRIAAAGAVRAAAFTAEKLWQRQLALIDSEWPALQKRADCRPVPQPTEELLTRCWQLLCATSGSDSSLLAELLQAVETQPHSGALHHALGIVTACQAKEQGHFTATGLQTAHQHFQRALECEPFHYVAGLNLAETLVLLGQQQPAVELAGRMLALLERPGPVPTDCWDAPHFPPAFDHFRVAWEKAAWQNAGQPAAEIAAKRRLLRWRLQTLLAELTGNLHHYHEAVLARPDVPSTRAALGCALARAGRETEVITHLREALERNPFDRQAARALFETLGQCGNGVGQRQLAEGYQQLSRAAPEALPAEDWFADTRPPIAGMAAAHESLAIVWEGAQAALHSLGLVNREICKRLIERGHEVSLLPSGAEEDAEQRDRMPPALRDYYQKKLARGTDIHIGHQWPPNLTPPSAGHWVIMQPWEFGSLPKSWMRALAQEVDAVWVYSRYLRDCYVRSGVPAERIRVVPLGVDTARFSPETMPLPLTTTKRFKFLFVGGTIYRKGIDVLLDAYAQTFTDQDDVCLVIKDMGNGSFYRGQTAEERIAQLQARAHAPAVEYLNRSLSDEELVGLYTACDCLVHPYRGEGFGLPIAEAMASGLPVIVTGYGAALDFCAEANAFLIPARVAPFRENRVGDLETVGQPWLAEPDAPMLRYYLRYVAEHPDEARGKGKAGCASIRQQFTWEHTAEMVEYYLQELRTQPIRRQIHGPVPESDLPVAATPAAHTPNVSVTIIAKNEEANLPDCIQSVRELVREVVVLDTGSTDRTVERAKSLGARVEHFPWVDIFAAARNESLRHATCRWVFWLDADDRLDKPNRQKLRELLAKLPYENVGYSMKCLCLPDASGTATIVDHIRLFRNLPEHRWTYRVHEQILPSLRRSGTKIEFCDVVIHHVGYQNPGLRGKKLERDLRLLRLENDEHPDDPFTLFNFGSVFLELNQPGEALAAIQRSIALSHPSDSIIRKLYAMATQCHLLLGQNVVALEACQAGRRLYPDDAELLLHEALVRRALGEFAGAENCLQKLLTTREKAHFASVDAGLQSYKARHQLATLYREQHRFDDAEAQWRAALSEQPQFLNGWRGLGELYLHQKRWDHVEEVVQQLTALPLANGEASVQRVRCHLARHDYEPAKQMLHEAIVAEPQALWPRVLLSHCYLQEGKDWAAAEQALRDVLALAPNDLEARNNLAVLLRQLGRAA